MHLSLPVTSLLRRIKFVLARPPMVTDLYIAFVCILLKVNSLCSFCQRYPHKGIMDVIKQVQGTFHPCSPRSDSAQQLSKIMPWQERPMDAAIDRVVDNVGNCLS